MLASWIIHGDQDSTVYIQNTYDFIDLVRKTMPDVEVRLDVGVGEDHGFDNYNPEWKHQQTESVEFLRRAWLRE
jgi:hypothetical protein